MASFLDAFPDVTHEQVEALLDLAKGTVLSQIGPVRDMARADPTELADQMIEFAIAEAFITEEDDQLPYDAPEAFWESVGLEGDEWPPAVMRLKRTVSRVVSIAMKERRKERLLAGISESRETFVEGLVAVAETLDDHDAYSIPQAFSEFWEEVGYDGYDLPREVAKLKDAIEAEAQNILRQKTVAKARAVLARGPRALAAELLSTYKEREQESRYGVHLDNVADEFWQTKGIADPDELPQELKAKVADVTKVAEDLLEREREAAREAERERLKELVGKYVGWAVQKGLKKVTLLDTELFLMRARQEASPEGKRFLYLEANDRLKSRR